MMLLTLFWILAATTIFPYVHAVIMMEIVDIREASDNEPYAVKPVIPHTATMQEAFPFVVLDLFVPPKDGHGLSSIPCQIMATSAITPEQTHVVEKVKDSVDNMTYVRSLLTPHGTVRVGFEIGVPVPKSTRDNRNHEALIRETRLEHVTKGLTARVLAGRAFGTTGPSMASHSVHILDLELEPFGYFTLELPPNLDTVLLVVYDGQLTRINEEPYWIAYSTVVLLNAMDHEKRGMSLETLGVGCKLLVLAGSRNNRDQEDMTSSTNIFLRKNVSNEKEDASSRGIALVPNLFENEVEALKSDMPKDEGCVLRGSPAETK